MKSRRLNRERFRTNHRREPFFQINRGSLGESQRKQIVRTRLRLPQNIRQAQSQSLRLPRTRTSDNQQRTLNRLNRPLLIRIQSFKFGLKILLKRFHQKILAKDS